MKNYIIVNQNNGVFVGEIWGLCFFSDLDPVGQNSVPAYANEKEADKLISILSRDGKKYKSAKVNVTTNGTATKEECLGAVPNLVWVD